MSSPAGRPFNSTFSKATYCFRIAAVEATAESASPCASIVINKIDLIVNRACVEESPKAARLVTINGVTVYPFYSLKTWRGETYGLMGISKLADTFPLTPTGGLTMCMEMARQSTCAPPERLCYGNSCVYSLINADFSCCPDSS
ncbi:hypothetical protein PLESTM_001928400 [Pleodorina starrii]|nr:hypothetical protein PLESTM_001928400 [Pleodorina starrii]